MSNTLVLPEYGNISIGERHANGTYSRIKTSMERLCPRLYVKCAASTSNLRASSKSLYTVRKWCVLFGRSSEP